MKKQEEIDAYSAELRKNHEEMATLFGMSSEIYKHLEDLKEQAISACGIPVSISTEKAETKTATRVMPEKAEDRFRNRWSKSPFDTGEKDERTSAEKDKRMGRA